MSNRTVLALGAAILLLTGCMRSSAQQVRTQAPTEVVAVVGSRSFTLAEVDERAMSKSTGNFGAMKLSQALYEARRLAIDEIIDDTLLVEDAKTRKLDAETLIEQEVTARATPPTDAEIEQWFAQNRDRVPQLQGVTLEQARSAIRDYLLQERTNIARLEYLGELRAKTAVRVTLEPPREVIPKADRPSQGPENAPIELIEFSDFQCPFCENAFPTVKKVLSTYGDRIHFIYRHFPLPNHPRARPAAEAAQCANEQGKFWAYHDRLFGDQSRLSDADFKQHAAELGLDAAQFTACYDSRKYRADVDTDIRVGNEAGVSGTPAFYINGRMLSGAQPFDVFKKVIDEELARR